MGACKVIPALAAGCTIGKSTVCTCISSVYLSRYKWTYDSIRDVFKVGPVELPSFFLLSYYFNRSVLKPSELAPLSCLLLGELCAEAGLPNGALNVLSGGRSTGAALAEHPDVDKVGYYAPFSPTFPCLCNHVV
jgi:hypothetical protein